MYKRKWEHQKEKEKDAIKYTTYNQWQSTEEIGVLVVVLFFFLFSSYPREYVVLAASGLLLFSRRMSSKSMLDFVDWQLLVFFGLFIVTQNLVETGLLQQGLSYFETFEVPLSSPWILFPFTAVIANIISNVPAVMLLLSFNPNEALYGSILALSSSLAGNLFILGSIANIIGVAKF